MTRFPFSAFDIFAGVIVQVIGLPETKSFSHLIFNQDQDWHCLIDVNTCAKSFENLPIHGEVRTRTNTILTNFYLKFVYTLSFIYIRCETLCLMKGNICAKLFQNLFIHRTKMCRLSRAHHIKKMIRNTDDVLCCRKQVGSTKFAETNNFLTLLTQVTLAYMYI